MKALTIGALALSAALIIATFVTALLGIWAPDDDTRNRLIGTAFLCGFAAIPVTGVTVMFVAEGGLSDE